MTITETWPTQIILAGQAAAPEGPLDMWMMYVVHHAYRRDLAAFVRAAERTPADAQPTWQALGQRWALFGAALHHHHHAEDTALWPLLMARVDDSGRQVLADMEAEHAQIDPVLEAVGEALVTLSRTADEDLRAALVVRLVAAKEGLGRHLAHEETEAIALMQQVMTEAEWRRMQDESFKPEKITLAVVRNMLPWTIAGVPDVVRERLLGDLPAGRLFWRLTQPGYNRRERRAFEYATV